MKLKSVLTAVIVLSLTIAGCLNYDQTTSLKIDGSGKMYIHYWTKMKSEQDSVLFGQYELFNKEEMIKSFKAPYTKIGEPEIYKDANDTTLHAKIEFEFTSIDSLNKLKVFSGSKFSFIDGPENTKIFSQYVQSSTLGIGLAADKKKFSVTYTYYIPGDVFEHNADQLSNNKLTWKFSLDDISSGKVIKATFRPFKLKETPIWILAVTCAVLVIVFIFLFKKKKK